jgi:hypothetical protein
MCYALHHRSDAFEPEGSTPPQPRRQLPRWLGAGLATLVGGVAVAGMLALAPASTGRQEAAPAPVMVKTSSPLPVAAAPGDARMLPADDDLPTAPAPMRAGVGHCHDGL